MKQAVCIIIEVLNKVVAISRRNNTNSFGFPGGKVDPGESIVDAICRETFEEIGFNLSQFKEKLYPIHASMEPGKGPNDSYWVTTFYLDHQFHSVEEVGNLLKEIKPEEGFVVQYLDLEQLTFQEVSQFYRYNMEVYGSYYKFKASKQYTLRG